MATRQEREEIAKKRLKNILRRHVVANSRTLEQKISDAGPFNQRIDPHILTTAIKSLIREEVFSRKLSGDTSWYFLKGVPESEVQRRLTEMEQVFTHLNQGDLPLRIGQALEIAIYKALLGHGELGFFGRFLELERYEDSRLYRKEQPPSYIGRRALLGEGKLDFLICHSAGGWGGIEAKNIRQWIYPNHESIKELLSKCIQLDCVPILIARRIHFLTFRLFSACGVIFHQTYNQRFPLSESILAMQAKDKRLLGYHDIKCGNEPDTRLIKFISVNLPSVLLEARNKFDKHKEVLQSYVVGNVSYQELISYILPQLTSMFDDYL